MVHTMHLHRVPPCGQIPLALWADSYFPQPRKNDLKVSEVMGVNCTSYFVRDFLLEESAWLGRFSSVRFCDSLNCTWAHILSKGVCLLLTHKPHSEWCAQRMSVVWKQLFVFPSAAVATRKAISNAPIKECQECLCGEGKKQRPELLWAEHKCYNLD